MKRNARLCGLLLLSLVPGFCAAVPLISHVVWSYDVEPNSLRVDRPGVFGVRSGRFTTSHNFQVRFGLYNLTLAPIEITGFQFDFWEDDGLVGDDLLVNNLSLGLPTPF